MHADNNKIPKTKTQLYDYLWVGENIFQIDKVREESKNHPSYVVPCFDFRNGKSGISEDEIYLHTIPYMQFPLLLAGRPFTGERATIPGVRYNPEEKDTLLRQWRAMCKYCQEHPEGPFVYGPWDSFPIWPDAKATHARWLKQYLPLVEEGTRVYLEVSDSDLFRSKHPSDVVVSVFANVETYLVLANYGSREVVIDTVHRYVPTAEPSAPTRTNWKLKGRSLVMLRQLM